MAVGNNLTPARYPQFGKGDINTWSTLIRTLENRDAQVNNYLNNLNSALDFVPYLDDIDSDPLTALRILSSASGGFVFKGRPGVTYTVSGGGVSANDSIVSVYNPSCVWIDMQGARFLVNDDSRQFMNIEAAMDCSASVSSVSVTTINFNGGTGASNQISKIALDVSISASRNDIFKIYSQDFIEGPDLADFEKKGEIFVVGSVESSGGRTNLFAYSALLDTYTSVIKLARYTNKFGSYQLKNMDFAMTSAPTVSAWNPNTIRLINTVGARVDNMSGQNLYSGLLVTLGCIFTKVNNLHAKNLTTDLAAEQFGYAWSDYSGYLNQGSFLSAINARNVFTTGTLAASAGETRPHYFGRTYFDAINDSEGMNNQSRSFSTHPDAWGCEFRDCKSIQGFTGPGGGSHGIQLRGRKNKAIDCYVLGPNGFIAAADASVSGNTQENSFINCTYECPADVSMGSTGVGFEFSGSPSLVSPLNYLENCVAIIPKGEGVVLKAADANLEFKGLRVRYSPTTDFQGFVIEASGSANIVGSELTTDYRGASGLTIRSVRLGGSGSGGSVVIDDWDIQASGTAYNSLVNGVNRPNWFVDISNVNIDVSMSTASGVAGATVSSTYWVDYKINKGRGGIRAWYPVTVAASANVSVSLNYRNAQEIFYDVVASAATNITGLAPGYAQGQKFNIINDINSTFPVSVEATVSGLIGIGTVRSINPGETGVLIYDGTKWV